MNDRTSPETVTTETDFTRKRKKSIKGVSPAFVLTFFILFFIWILLSGKLDFFHLFLGVVSCLIVSIISNDLIFSTPGMHRLPTIWIRFIGYIPWLLYQVLLSNIHVLYLVLHPKMMDLIDPRIIQFKSRLTSDISLVTFANSITLTPGTITVYVSIYGDFQVHVIDKHSGQALPGEMEARVGKIFGE
ncbi:MAG: Na+/H+ antiporter subunit E [Deltaproteobacteria bacterium]|nr:Na+/H+ antiporter subunit E [Deltaproteobacteria bacterium]